MRLYFCRTAFLLLAIVVAAGCHRQVDDRTLSADDAEPTVKSDSRPEPPAPEVDSGGNDAQPIAIADEAGAVDDIAAANAIALEASLQEQRRKRDESVWKKERLAQVYEGALVNLWDQLLAEQRKPVGDMFRVFSEQPLGSIRIGKAGESQHIGWQAFVASLDQQIAVLPVPDWQALIQSVRADGYQIVQTEWHHAKFDAAADGTAKSTVNMAIYAEHPEQETRYVVSGELDIVWLPMGDGQSIPVPDAVDATRLRIYSRKGPLAFVPMLTIDHATPATKSGVQPVILQDLNEDGLSEIILGGANVLLWNRGDGKFETDQLVTHHEPGFETAIVADISGDAKPDYLTTGLAGDLLLYVADEHGRFTGKPKGKARGGGPLRQPQVMTAGDVDGDGDLDLWVGQYKISYVGGQMPTPYFDANDGFPAFFLINDGSGRFAPQTEEAGLAEKRFRRSYGGSFVDLDGDRDLDLLVVSDFSGIDIYHNDGDGYFTDVTDDQVDERHLFGMAATFSDFNVDGELDFFVTGMASTTARRLEYMRLGRRDRPEVHLMRSRMGYGNRMYLASNARFEEPTFRDDVARTGWTWGTTTLDFDNDGFPDIFVANGHSSGKSTKDHCSHFWCHDIYDATSAPNREVFDVFNMTMKGYYDRSESWDGYQKSQLLVNTGGTGFVSLGFLMGVGQENDGRAVVSDDVDGDGRKDLIVVEDRWQDGQLLHVYRNQLENENHWIGIRLVDRPGPDSPIGVAVVLMYQDGSQRIECVTSGDSIHAQHANTVHFGIGDRDSVQSIEIRLVSGKTMKLTNPEVDQYHVVEIE